MKRKRINFGWLFVLTVMALYLFTPLGFHVQVWANRLLSPSPQFISGNTPVKPKISEWRLIDLNGGTFYADELEGKVVVINFWASWCAPCVAEMPSLAKLYEEFGDRAHFLFVARDQKDLVISYLKKNNYNFPVYFESQQAPTDIYNTSLPTTYILNKKGQIIVSHTGAANWYAEDMRKLLDSLLIK